MKKIIYRFAAFIIDMVICTIIIMLLSSVHFFNPLGKEADSTYQRWSGAVQNREDFNGYFERMLADDVIESREYQVITDDYDSYSSVFVDVKIDEEITEEDQQKLLEDIDIKYIEIINEYGYKINKLIRYQTIISIIIYMLYFTTLEVIFKGQTLGKKLLHVKVVDNKDINKKIPIWKYALRTVLSCEVIFLILEVILVTTLKQKTYISFEYWISNIKYIYEMAFLACIIVRDDQRSIHDLLLGTKVIRIDSSGKEIEDVLFQELNNEEEVVIEPKKKQKKKKEVVEAIKVNDKKRINKDN